MELDFSADLTKIQKFVSGGDYEETIEKSLKILEKCLQYFFDKVFTDLNIDIQLEILEDLKNNYDGRKFDKLFIGVKLTIFDKYDLLKYLNIKLPKDIKIKEFMRINDLRVAASHDQNREMTEGEARYAQSMVMRFLEYIGLLQSSIPSDESSIKKELNSSGKQDKYVLENLPQRDYGKFIGREDIMDKIISLLLHDRVTVLSIDGIGGVGKSALALEIAYKLKNDKIFDAIIWVSAKKDILTYKGITPVDTFFETIEDFFNEILKVFDEGSFLKHGKLESKKNRVLELLKENRCLLIVDNLETINDKAIKDFIIDVNFPIESKVLVTSRKRLGEVERVVYLDEFTKEDTNNYILTQLKNRSYPDLFSEELGNNVYDNTGGIPLAIKLIIPWIAEGKLKEKFVLDLDKETDILKFCFGKVYNEFLSEQAKKLFCVMAEAPTEINEEALKFISDIPQEKFYESLSLLENYSLVYIDRSKDNIDEFYTILPLTREFALKISKEFFPDLKVTINKSYLKFIELKEKKGLSSNAALAINKAEEALREYRKTNDIKVGKNLLKQAINYDDKNDYVYYLAAIFFREINDLPKAENSIVKAIKINEKNPTFWIEYSEICLYYRGPKTAEKILEDAVEKIEKDRDLKYHLIKIKQKLQKNTQIIKLSKENILHKTRINKQKKMNTLFAICILEGHWRIAREIEEKSPKLAIKEILDGIKEIDDLLHEKCIFGDHRGILWKMKRSFRELGYLSTCLYDYKPALVFYRKSLFDLPLFDDQKKHNSRILSKIERIENMK